jgi:hypothetical protein
MLKDNKFFNNPFIIPNSQSRLKFLRAKTLGAIPIPNSQSLRKETAKRKRMRRSQFPIVA